MKRIQPQLMISLLCGVGFAAYKFFSTSIALEAVKNGVIVTIGVFTVLILLTEKLEKDERQQSYEISRIIDENKKKAESATPLSTKVVTPNAPLSKKSSSSASRVKPEKVERESKGRSIIRIPRHYTVVDTETTGLDPQKNRLIEIAAIRVRNGKEVARFETLVNPKRKLSQKIVQLTGITEEELKSAPTTEEALKKFMEFLQDDVIVAHNANFDVDFLYDSLVRCGYEPLKNNFVDTLRLARCVCPGFENYKLATLAQEFQIDQPTAHRALADCETTLAVMEKLRTIVAQEQIDLTKFQKTAFLTNQKVAGLTAHPGMERPESSVYQKTFAFTGELESMTRREAAQAVLDLGGICKDQVSSKVNYLVVGTPENYSTSTGAKKQKALELVEKGKEIHFLTESMFLTMLKE